MIQQLIFGWLTKDGEEAFSGKTDAGLKATTGNPNFTALAAMVAACQAAYVLYLLAKANAKQGGVDQTAARNARRAELVGLLRSLISNINASADGDAEKLLSSGFPLRSTNRSPIGPLATPAAPIVTQGSTTGVLKASTPPVYGASLYTARLALASAPTVYLQTQQGTGAHFEFDGLTPGELYNVDMDAIGTAGPSDWSDVGTMRVV
jgi:hypothetical protein